MVTTTTATKLSIVIAITLWASAYAGIRLALLAGFSPEGLALLRYLIASCCMGIIYFRMPKRQTFSLKEMSQFFCVGIVGIAVYNIALNYGELTVSSGMASFIISQSPAVAALFAIIFLGEPLNRYNLLGLAVCMFGIFVIAMGEVGAIVWSDGLLYVLIATIAGGLYNVMQKSLLNRFHVIEAISFVIWGATLFLCIYTKQLQHDLAQASWSSTLIVVYLGIFPAAIAYLAWGYALREMPTAKAVSFLYFMPFIATMIGWITLGEVPAMMSLVGGVIAIFGVWLVNQSYSSGSTAKC